MGITRRALLQGGVAALVASSAPLRWANPFVGLPAFGSLNEALWLTRSTYVPLVKSAFSVASPAGPATLKLVAVRDIPTTGGVLAGQGCFSLLFDGGASRLDQGRYSVSHRLLGSTELFLVPVGRPAQGRQAYEVVVNRP